MNLSLIKSEFQQYIRLSQGRSEVLLEISAQYDRFSEHWDLRASDIHEMIEASLDGTHVFWSGPDYHPYESLLAYAQFGPEMVRSAFTDLLDEKKDLVGRIDRFQFHLNWLEKNSQDPKHKQKPHYHTVPTIMQYLSMAYPERYLLYDAQSFVRFLDRVGAKKDPIPSLERFFKVSAIILKIISKELEQLYLDQPLKVMHDRYPVILISDFLGTVSKERRK